ncbi:MAG: outer membrane beta-barrel protein [Proteobacteria bacterium]|nr:outer membrane beta-barrel protein [Pseudomonadota bacterium]
MKMKALIFVLALAALTLGAVGGVQAADPKFVVKVGLADVEPKSNNGTLDGTTLGIDIGNSVRPSITFEYLITPNIGIELLAAWPFRNDVSISTLGNVATVDVLPPTLSVQYHFFPDKMVSPFLGVGLNYAFIYSEETKGALAGNSIDVDNSWGFAAHAGVDINFNEHWLMTVDLRWIQMSGDVTLNGAKVASVDIDPWVLGVAVGYRF